MVKNISILIADEVDTETKSTKIQRKALCNQMVNQPGSGLGQRRQ